MYTLAHVTERERAEEQYQEVCSNSCLFSTRAEGTFYSSAAICGGLNQLNNSACQHGVILIKC